MLKQSAEMFDLSVQVYGVSRATRGSNVFFSLTRTDFWRQELPSEKVLAYLLGDEKAAVEATSSICSSIQVEL